MYYNSPGMRSLAANAKSDHVVTKHRPKIEKYLALKSSHLSVQMVNNARANPAKQ